LRYTWIYWYLIREPLRSGLKEGAAGAFGDRPPKKKTEPQEDATIRNLGK
jgi:hypothetical protein